VSTDYKNMIRLRNAPKSQHLARNKQYAGHAREIVLSGLGLEDSNISWVKGHQAGGQQRCEESWFDYVSRRGNEFADLWADKGARLHPQQAPNDLLNLDVMIKAHQEIAALAWQALEIYLNQLPMWQADNEWDFVAKPAKRPRGSPGAKSQGLPHRWVYRSGHWTCECCLHRCTTLPKGRLMYSTCRGECAIMIKVMANHGNHRLVSMETSENGFMIACLLCGGWTCKNPHKLVGDCVRTMGNSTRFNLRGILAGKHPSKEMTLGKAVKVGAVEVLGFDD
jgi:hypothetical protein